MQWASWGSSVWDSLCFLDFCHFFSPQIREIFHHYFFKQCLCLCSSSSPSGIPIIWILLFFMLSCISLIASSFFLSLFSFSCSFWVFFFYLVLQFADLVLCFIKPAFDSFYWFFSSEIVFFIIVVAFLIF